MIGFLFFLFGLLAAIGMCGLAAWSDYKGFRIPNSVPLVVAAGFLLAFGVTTLTGQREHMFMPLAAHLGVAFVVLMLTMVLYAFKLFGAGDSKFASAIALWLSVQGLAAFFFYMTLVGGVLGLISLGLKKWRPLKNPAPGSWFAKAQEGHNAVPYGIAIALGALIAFGFMGYFSLEKWAAMFNA